MRKKRETQGPRYSLEYLDPQLHQMLTEHLVSTLSNALRVGRRIPFQDVVAAVMDEMHCPPWFAEVATKTYVQAGFARITPKKMIMEHVQPLEGYGGYFLDAQLKYNSLFYTNLMVAISLMLDILDELD